MHDGHARLVRLLTRPLGWARSGPGLGSALLLVIFPNVLLPRPGIGASLLPESLFYPLFYPKSCSGVMNKKLLGLGR